jgi:hypothetical protein
MFLSVHFKILFFYRISSCRIFLCVITPVYVSNRITVISNCICVSGLPNIYSYITLHFYSVYFLCVFPFYVNLYCSFCDVIKLPPLGWSFFLSVLGLTSFFLLAVDRGFCWICSHLMTHTHTQTLGRCSLDEGSAHHREMYLTTHNIHKRQTAVPLAGF